MKKFTSIILILTIILSCFAFSGCDWDKIFPKKTTTSTTTTPEDPFKSLKEKIIEDYLIWSGIQSDKKPEEIQYEFYGQYGESAAVYFHTAGAYENEKAVEEIAGFTFSYPDTRVIRIYNNGKFYKMPEAFEMGLINESHVETIYEQFENIEFTEPYFIYEGKYLFDLDYHNRILYSKYCNGMHPGVIEVFIDESLSRHKKVFDSEFFAGIDIDYIEETSYFKDRPTEELSEEDLDGYYQRFNIHLKDKTEEAVLEAIPILEKIDGISAVAPLYIPTGIPDYHLTPNDEYYTDETDPLITQDDQWALNTINIEKVWDFTTGNDSIFSLTSYQRNRDH